MKRLRRLAAAAVDLLLGPRCHWCHTRVFPRDSVAHYRVCCTRPAHSSTKGRS